MDGKYAKYIPSSYGFITKLEIVDDTLYGHTKETAKRDPHKYPIRERIVEFSGRLENQYRLITDNKNLQVIKNDLIHDKKSMLLSILVILSGPISLTSILSALALSTITPLAAGAAAIGALLVAKQIILNKVSTDFDKEMDTIKTYLNYRSNIEEMSQEDSNVTNNLSRITTNRIDTNRFLYEDGIVPEIFDITLLDELISKTKTKKELEKLLTNYKICAALRQPQIFVNPNEESVSTYNQTDNGQKPGKYVKTRKPNDK